MKILLLVSAALTFVNSQILGGQQPYKAELNDPLVVIAVQGINEHLEHLGDNHQRVAQKIISATFQVVAGILYRFKIEVTGGAEKELCRVTILQEKWLEGKNATVVGTPVCSAEHQQAIRQPGQPEDVDLSDDEVNNALKFLEANFTATRQSKYYLIGFPMGGITKQVVNGDIFKFTDVEYSSSGCDPKTVNDANYIDCVDKAVYTDTEFTCTTEVYYNPREDPQYVINNNDCENGAESRRRQLLGQPVKVDLTDSGALNALKYLQTHVTITSRSIAYIVAVEFGGITKQVVNGVLYKFSNVQYAKTVCNVEAITSSNYDGCIATAVGNPVLFTCTSEVYYNPRTDPQYKLNSHVCVNA